MRVPSLFATSFLVACSSSSSGTSPADASTNPDTPPSSQADAATDAAPVGDASLAADAALEGGGDTWTSYARAFMVTYCVECHSTGNSQGLDFTQYAKVLAEKDVIRCGVSAMQDPSWSCPASPVAKQFPIDDGKTPPNPKPTDAERTRFVAWLSAGAPE